MGARDIELQRLGRANRPLRVAAASVMLYLAIYTFESPLRYVFHLLNASAVILTRDLLIVVPVAMLALRGVLRHHIHKAYWAFGLFIGIASAVSVMNFGAFGPAALGGKMLVNVLFGLVAGATLIIPGKLTARYLLALWLATISGLLLEKYVVTFPWVGVRTIIGGLEVEISRDWQVGDLSSQRVGGFTKESISAAGLLANLGLVAVFQFRSQVMRAAVLAVTIGGVYLTTQKGALIAVTLVSLVLCSPRGVRLPALRLVAIGAILLEIGLPLLTNGLIMHEGHGGVFSATSFAERVNDTWPKSLEWVSGNQVFPFGSGLGGIGQSQALLGDVAQHYPDNIFLFFYASFGLPCVLLFGWIVLATVRSITIDPDVAEPALAALAFSLLYGIVVTVVEDQVGALFIGSAVGVLLWATPTPLRRPATRVRGAAPAT